MQIPFEQDMPVDPPADPIASDEPVVDQVAAEPAIAPVEAPSTEPVDPPAPVTPDEEPTPPVTPNADPAAAQRRITMQLYSRMVTDLKVLTGDKRLPTDAEIDEALVRATRALGIGRATSNDAVWRQPAGGARPVPQFASFDPADPARRLPVLAGMPAEQNPWDMPENFADRSDGGQGQVAAGQGSSNVAAPPAPVDAKQQARAARAARKAREKAEKAAKKIGPVSKVIEMSSEDFELSNGSPWTELAPRVPTKAEKKAMEQAEDDRVRQNKDRTKRGLPEIQAPPKGELRQKDLAPALERQLRKPGSVAYDKPNPDIAQFVLRIAAATAKAKIRGGSQEFEKTMVISPDPGKTGKFKVRWIGLAGKNGGSLPATRPGDVIVHVHYAGLNQPPHESDFSAALDGRVSYVISQDGKKVWEVRRNDKSIAIDPRNPAERLKAVEVGRVMPGNAPGSYEPFQIDPENYRNSN